LTLAGYALGLNLAGIAAVAWIPFLVADLSNFSGGYQTLRRQRAGWSVNRTRNPTVRGVVCRFWA